MQGHYAYETDLCEKNEESFSPAKYFLKIVLRHSGSIKIVEVFGASLRSLLSIFWEIVRSARVFSPLPTLLKLFYSSTGVVALSMPWVRSLAGQCILKSQVLTVGRQLLEVQGSQCPSLLPGDSWLFIRLLRSLPCSLLTGRRERLCSGLLIDPMGITLIWCLALVLIKWITSKVGHIHS